MGDCFGDFHFVIVSDFSVLVDDHYGVFPCLLCARLVMDYVVGDLYSERGLRGLRVHVP